MASLRCPHRRPTHPGAILREDVLPAMNISIGEFAERLGVSRKTVSNLINERISLTDNMAVRLSHYFNTSAESWINMQAALNIWELNQANEDEYNHIREMAS